jgi:Protein of unknown function (DUF2911)
MLVRKAFFSFIAIFLAATTISYAQAPAARKSPHDTVSNKNITVTYGRPYKKGRDIFGKLEPFGKVYRVGADEATTITFKTDGMFGGKAVKAGTYTLFAIPNQAQWTIILNSQLGQWGAFKYDQYKDKDVLHVDVPVVPLSAPVEQLTIAVGSKDLTISWDMTKVVVPVKF